MHASLSTLGKTESLLRTTNLNVTRIARLAELSGISSCSEASLSRALKGGKGLPPESDRELREMILRIESLIEKAKPFELSFNDPVATKQILDNVASGRMWFAIITDTTEPVPTNG